jgi:hypothetical protein
MVHDFPRRRIASAPVPNLPRRGRPVDRTSVICRMVEADAALPAESRIPPEARTAIEAAPATWEAWLSLLNAADHPDVEILIEDFAPILSTFRVLLRAGVPFAPAFIARMTELESECIDLPDDPDAGDDDVVDHEQCWSDGDGMAPGPFEKFGVVSYESLHRANPSRPIVRPGVPFRVGGAA